jgi:uncharacterized protein (DUF2141 family)
MNKKVFLVMIFLACLAAIPRVHAIVGDVNGDGKVNMQDIMLVLDAFGSYPGHSRWNAACDLNGDGKVDMADLTIVLSSFGH